MNDFDKFDPFIECPFDNSELVLVEEAEGYKKDQPVLLDKLGVELNGTIHAIGTNAKYGDGSTFTAVIVKADNSHHLCTTAQIKALN